MFQKILQWIREVVNKMLNPSSVKTALHVDTLVTQEMANALQRWSSMYGNESPWLVGGVKSLNLAASIASEVARAVTIEMQVELSGSPRAEFLVAQLGPVLNNIRTYTEYGVAKGGLMFKPYPKGDGLAVDCVQADQFYPIAFDGSGVMTSCIFADLKVVGQNYFTRFEYHALTADGYRISNTAYKSTTEGTLGSQVPLSSVAEWAELEPEALILNVDKPLFAYFKMPFANNIDTTSPLGVSIYSRASHEGTGGACLMQQADQQWTDFLWEFESGRRALYTDPLAFGKDAAGKPIIPNKRFYRTLDLQTELGGKGLFEDWTPTLRETNILNGLDAILRRIEFACGLSYGVLSNPDSVALTATEIKSSQQRYYSTVTDIQKSLQVALEGAIYAMDVWSTIYNLAPKGTYKTTYKFDDSVVADHDTQYTQDSQTVTMNAMPKYVFLMRNYGLSETDARKWVEEAKSESPAPSFFPVGE
jgi:A118 family predicted phage portal protein